MDIGILEKLLKEDSRKCFEKFKHSLIHNPFGEVTEDLIENCIEFEINQNFAKKSIKEVMNQNLSDIQLDYLDKEINKYKEITLKTARNYAKKLIE